MSTLCDLRRLLELFESSSKRVSEVSSRVRPVVELKPERSGSRLFIDSGES